MGAFKKQVRSEIRRSARMVLEGYLKKKKIYKSKNQINDIVRKAEKEIVPNIIGKMRSD